MIDFNDPNFLLADSDPLKDREIERSKKRIREALAIGLVFLLVWGAALFAIIAALSE
jgi:hypothetical protein